MIKQQKGFTLIELVIVLVILGILAAIAIPKYISITRDARIASVNGIAGGLRGAVALARAKYMVVGNNAAITVDMDGTLVACAAGTGIPTASTVAPIGIPAAMQDTSGYTITPIGATVQFSPGIPAIANCYATYTGATGLVTTTIAGC